MRGGGEATHRIVYVFGLEVSTRSKEVGGGTRIAAIIGSDHLHSPKTA